MGNFHTHLPKLEPLRLLVVATLSLETDTAGTFRLHPLPRDIQLLEIHVCALSTRLARISLHAKQCVLVPSTRDVYQDMLAWLHQVEALAMNIWRWGSPMAATPLTSGVGAGVGKGVGKAVGKAVGKGVG